MKGVLEGHRLTGPSSGRRLLWVALLSGCTASHAADVPSGASSARSLPGAPLAPALRVDDTVAGVCVVETVTTSDHGTAKGMTVFALTDDGLPIAVGGDITARWHRVRDRSGSIVYAAYVRKGSAPVTEAFEDGRVTRIGDDLRYTWDDAGRPTSKRVETSDGTRLTEWAWNDDGLPTSLAYSDDDPMEDSRGWSWDDEGRLVAEGSRAGDEFIRTTFTDWDEAGHPTIGTTTLSGYTDYTEDVEWSWNADGGPDSYVEVGDDGRKVTTTWRRKPTSSGGTRVIEVIDTDGKARASAGWELDAEGRIIASGDERWRWTADGRLIGYATPSRSTRFSGDCPRALTRRYEPVDWKLGPYPDIRDLPDPSGAW